MKLKLEFKERFQVEEDISLWDLTEIMYEYDLKTEDVFTSSHYRRWRRREESRGRDSREAALPPETKGKRIQE